MRTLHDMAPMMASPCTPLKLCLSKPAGMLESLTCLTTPGMHSARDSYTAAAIHDKAQHVASVCKLACKHEALHLRTCSTRCNRSDHVHLQHWPFQGAEMASYGSRVLMEVSSRLDVNAGGSYPTRVGTLTLQAASMRRNTDMPFFLKHRAPTMRARASRSRHGIILDICAPHSLTRLARP